MTSGSQKNNLMWVDSPLGEDVLLLRRFRGTERISEPFTLEVEVLTVEPVAPDDLLTKTVTVGMKQSVDTDPRYIHGMVRSMTRRGRLDGYHVYQLQVVPWLRFLSLARDCRIFQQKTAKDIVEQIFKDWNMTDFRFACTGKFPVRDFTVQYRESDFDFVSRLLEEEGVFYFFEYTKDKHTLVLADHPGAVKVSPTLGEDVLFRAADQALAFRGVVDSLSVDAEVHTGKWAVDDYSFEKPTANLFQTVGEGVAEVYDYPGLYDEASRGGELVNMRLDAEEALSNRVRGTGTCVGLLPGFKFKLTEAPHDDDNGEYFVTEVEHESATYSYLSSEDPDLEYRNRFTAIPADTKYRPLRRTPMPTVKGAQTAVVVGPEGEEIYTDQYGRVKVLFHWDREGKDDGTSSCWIRVASTWAGSKWGAIQIPRIGQEVIVEFLEGNPDRPIITGSVYNAQQMPPFDAKPTQSGWKSHSTKEGAARSNEFRFEDKKGSEEIYLHAEKDLVFAVVNNEKGTVGHDRTITVRNDEKTTVEKVRTVLVKIDEKKTVEHDQSLKVDGEQTIKVGDDQKVKIGMDQTIELTNGDRSITLKKGDLTTEVSLGKIVYEAMQSIELKVGDNSIKIDQKGIEIRGTMVKVTAGVMAELSAQKTTVEGKGMVEVKGAMAQINGSGMTAVKGGVIMIG